MVCSSSEREERGRERGRDTQTHTHTQSQGERRIATLNTRRVSDLLSESVLRVVSRLDNAFGVRFKHSLTCLQAQRAHSECTVAGETLPLRGIHSRPPSPSVPQQKLEQLAPLNKLWCSSSQVGNTQQRGKNFR